MPTFKIQNFFNSGIVQKDLQERFIDGSTLIDAENVFVDTNGASNTRGVIKQVMGNLKRTDYQFSDGISIGAFANENKSCIYHFIKASDYDYYIEYNTISDTSRILLQSTTEGALNFQTGERIRSLSIVPSGEGTGDIHIWSGDSNPPRAINIERASTWGVDGFTAEEIMLIKPPPAYPPLLEGTTSNENVESNTLEDRFLTFCYYYKYKDGYYSAFSSWTPYFFVPRAFQLDFDTSENLGMLNARNGVNITFNTGKREVVAIGIVFKLSNSPTPYLVDEYVKEEEGWSDETIQTLQFNNNKVYRVLSESQYYRSFDNVPLTAYAQTMIGNRVSFGNYVEQRDIPTVMDYSLSLVSNQITSIDLDVFDTNATYDYSGSDVDVDNAVINIDFTDVIFVAGASIQINFSIMVTRDDDTEVVFDGLFFYILEDNYDNLADLIANSNIQNELETQFTSFFEDNGGVSPPDDYVPPYVLEQGFGMTSSGETMIISLPVIKYEIDNTPDPNTFIWDYFYDNQSRATYTNIAVSSSLKSYRSYEVVMIYIDPQGRKTTALASENNTIFIPVGQSAYQNQIKVTIPITMVPPDWADRYKFCIKVNKGQYETIYASIFFVDENYRWVLLQGESKNKVKDGDILLVKRDSGGVVSDVTKVKVLAVEHKEKDFLPDNVDPDDNDIIEPEGTYMKIVPSGFEMNYDEDEFRNFYDRASSRKLKPYAYSKNGNKNGLRKKVGGVYQDVPVNAGSSISLKIHNYEAGGEDNLFEKEYTVNNDYASFKDWWDDNITLPLVGSDPSRPYNEIDFVYGILLSNGQINITGNPTDDIFLRVHAVYSGQSDEASRLHLRLNIRSVDGYFVFETLPPDAPNEIFYECPETYTITGGAHEMVEHTLTQTFNCFSFGNGSESYQIRDGFNEKYLSMDFCPTSVSDDKYRQLNRYADITYSGVFDENTNVNKLNEFNLSLANYKDNMEKSYGSIQKMRGLDTNLEVFQQDKVSKVFYEKDLLYNADGTTNLARIENVLGQQDTDAYEYGISNDPDGFDFYANDEYYTDVKRGVVIKKNKFNGQFEISSQGMNNYFRTLFRNHTIEHVLGRYDQFNNVYILNIKYDRTQYVTWLYSDQYNGWMCRHTFNPESMLRVNNRFYSLYEGEIYEHNQSGENGENYSVFYGEAFDSKYTFNFSQYPSDRKQFKALAIEGTAPWNVSAQTDLNTGYINEDDFELKEAVYYGYLRASNADVDTALLSSQGIGVATVNGNTLEFGFDLDSSISIGDFIYNQNMLIVGTILSKTANTLTLDDVPLNVNNGDFVLCVKPQSAEVSALTGTNLKVEMSTSRTTLTETYSVEAICNKSFV